MKAKMLKIAGVKSEAAFYKKFPNQEAFMKVHGKEFKKAQLGANINLAQPAYKPLSYATQFDEADKMITGSTGAERQAALDKKQAAAPQSGGGGFDIGGLMKMASSLGGEDGGGEMDLSSLASGKYGRAINKAQFGGSYDLGQTPSSGLNMQQGFPQAQNSFSMQAPKFNAYDPQGDQSGTAMAKNIFEGANALPNAPQENGWTKTAGMLGKYAGPVGDIIGGIGALQQEKEAAKAAKQTKLVSDVSLQAATSTDVDARRQMQDTFSKQRNAMMQPNVNLNAQGVGTNVLGKNGLQLKGGGEIQNTYAPDTLFDDLGYEPLNDSNTKQYYHGGRIHQMQDGGGTPWGAISSKATGMGQELMGGQNAGGQIGGTAGKAIGNAIVPGIGGAVGEFIGGIAGNALDPYAKRIKKDNAATQRNMQGMASANMAKGIQSQNQSYMEDGGWVSNDWQPQVIASFGDHSAKDVYDFAHEGMDTLRAGGHLRDYTPPSDRAMEIYKDGGDIQSHGLGGELQTHWGGGAETISRNPYLPGTGETVMFRGKSHEEYSPNGETGIGVTYGGNPVEVERGEPMVELQEGGTIDPQTGEVQKSGVVFGNLKIPNQYIDMLGDNKAKGKKFKNYVNDLSKIEDRQNTLIEKSTKELNELNPRNSFDKLKLTALQASIQGANMKLKDLADKKINAASLQNAINDTAEEQGIVADDLARGKVKIDKEARKQYAKFGGKFTQAQNGLNKLSDEDLIKQADMQGGELDEVVIPAKRKPFGIPNGIFNVNPKNLQGVSKPQLKQNIELPSSFSADTYDNEEGITPSNPYIDMFNQMLPQIRPTDQEELEASQLYPEMFAMANNQVSPVQANFYHPELGTSYDISRQAAKNDLIAQTRAAQRQVGYNPAAQAMIAAQAYNPMQQLNEADFIANQANRDKVYGENRNTLNQAKLTNLEIADKQYGRQSEAMSNTKATTQAALNSIADKYAKNKLENRQLGVMENMYNYRYDDKGRLINMNPLAQFNTEGLASTGKPKDSSGDDLLPIYDNKGTVTGYKVKQDNKVTKAKSKNGSIVKSYKNL